MNPDAEQPESLDTRDDEIVVFIVRRDTQCDQCGEELLKNSWIRLERLKDENRALCLKCAGLDHLEFLPRGSTAVTRRASKYSSTRAVVVRWSRARKQYERQGILAETEAIKRAEAECLTPAELAERKRIRELQRRMDELDAKLEQPQQD